MKRVIYNLKLDEIFFVEKGTDFVDTSSLPQTFEIQCRGKQAKTKLWLMKNDKGFFSGKLFIEIEEEIKWK